MFGFLLFATVWLAIGLITAAAYVALCFKEGKFRGADIQVVFGMIVLGPVGLIAMIKFWLDDLKNKTLWERKQKDAAK